ncbi:MAG: protein-glutamate O-methyltransferase CheR, partial [Planctomycetota bacterium]
MTPLTTQTADLSEKDFLKISKIVYEHCGINLYKDKKELVRARVAKRLRLGNFKTFSGYIKYVLADKTGKEFSILIDSLSTNLTGFFREPQHFDFVRSEFLPLLLERKKKKRNFKIRTW